MGLRYSAPKLKKDPLNDNHQALCQLSTHRIVQYQRFLHSSSKGPLVLCKLKECTIGAFLVITNTVLGAPYDNYSIMGPKPLF